MANGSASRVFRLVTQVVLLPTLASLVCVAVDGDEPDADATTLSANAATDSSPTDWRPLNPAHVEGHTKCVDCHKSEVVAWLQSKHASGAFDMLRTNPKSREFAEKMDISAARIATDSLCTKCHATQQQTATGNIRTLGGVSCESCHNASGGEHGWLNLHAVYGPQGTRREQESPEHFQTRMAASHKAGQYRSADAYLLAKSCYECHVVSEEELVAKGGHPTGSFELVEWSQGEVRHNFHINQRLNAAAPSLWIERQGTVPADRKRLLFVVGQLVDMEVSLRIFCKATDPNFASAAGQRVIAANGILTGVNSVAPVPEVQAALDAVAKVMDQLFQLPMPDHKAELDEVANQVAVAAKKFSQMYNGSTMAAIDAFVPQGQKGPIFEPK